MAPRIHTKQTILKAIRHTARKLGHVPTGEELHVATRVPRDIVLQHFDSFAAALLAAGLKPRPQNVHIPDSVLLEAWGRLVRELRHIPSKFEYARRGKYSHATLFKRFRRWAAIPALFLQAFQDRPEWDDVCRIAAAFRPSENPRALKKYPDRPACGNPLNFRGIRNEPVNENGVIALFGAIALDLGFQIEFIQPGFPDCFALRKIGEDRWQLVSIEFEHLSRSFRDSGHPTKGCDIIVCWRDNWPACPLEVIELSSKVKELQQREASSPPS